MNQKSLKLNHKFDAKTKRHYLNNTLTVLHCHHYATLYTQLAIDAGETKLLQDVSKKTFYKVLNAYCTENKIATIEEKIAIGCQYYATIGLGQMDVKSLGDFSGEVTLHRSHVDEGWIKKWNKYDKPVNYITAGYIEALFSVATNRAIDSFSAREVESIVKGAQNSRFSVVSN